MFPIIRDHGQERLLNDKFTMPAGGRVEQNSPHDGLVVLRMDISARNDNQAD
jgi:hypothetical protein